VNSNQAIEKLFDGTVRQKLIHEAVLLVENTNGSFSVSCGYGGKDVDSLIFTASIGKMYATACILILHEQGKLSLDDGLDKYFSQSVLDGLHIYKGVEYSHQLTVADLLFQNSGLPDPFEEGGAKAHALTSDISMSFGDKLAKMKTLKPHFAPGDADRAYYSDFNFDLLGEIIEKITGENLDKVYRDFVFEPLGLTKTYLPANEQDDIPKIYFKDEALHRPKTILSFRAGGACVSTARETMTFLKAFWDGLLFPKCVFEKLAAYRKLQADMSPLKYGGGYMQMPLGGPATMFSGKGELIGHSGSTSCCAYYYPLKDLYIVCDLNQMAQPALPIRLAVRIAITV